MTTRIATVATLAILFGAAGLTPAQEKSLSPDVNAKIGKNAKQAMNRFESPKRDVVKRSDELLEACELKAGMSIADVGAGSGLHARLFARQVVPDGKVYAVEIFDEMLKHIATKCSEQGIENVVCVKGTTTSSKLKPESVDVVFTCNTYHHFEFPFKMLESIHSALRTGGRLIVIDDKKKSDHVRAAQATVVEEVERAGFRLVDQKGFSERNFLARFEKK